MDRILVSDDPREASRWQVRRVLREGNVPFEEDDDGIWVPRSGVLEEAEDLVPDLLAAHDDVQEAARQQGVEIRPYKPLERHVVFVAIVAALREATGDADVWSRLLHELVWAQGLPNANHRSTLLFVTRLMLAAGEVLPEDTAVMEVGEKFAIASKPLIGEKEWMPSPTVEKAAHLDASRRAIAELRAPA